MMTMNEMVMIKRIREIDAYTDSDAKIGTLIMEVNNDRRK